MTAQDFALLSHHLKGTTWVYLHSLKADEETRGAFEPFNLKYIVKNNEIAGGEKYIVAIKINSAC